MVLLQQCRLLKIENAVIELKIEKSFLQLVAQRYISACRIVLYRSCGYHFLAKKTIKVKSGRFYF